MDLFSNDTALGRNLLPQGGTVIYFGTVMTIQEADFYLDCLLKDIAWKNDEAIIFGKLYITKRKVAWYADEPFDYSYSNVSKKALPWTRELLALKRRVEEISSERYNSCLLNLYHHGTEGMAYHSDAEKDLKKDGAIASLSLGAERKFNFRHKQTKERISLILEHGSLLVMKGSTQKNWQHRLPPTQKVIQERMNLTFRTIVK